MSKYSSYKVGYAGDYASVVMDFNEPVITRSERPKDKHHRESFEVVTTSQTFNQGSLSKAVEGALASKDYSSYVMLLEAQSSLNHFVRENGAINPLEAADWEDYSNAGFASQNLEMA